MEKEYYLIKEAAKEVHVETHVLRYWEEELGLPIKRNAKGHRVYSKEDVIKLIRVKKLKDEGLQLKAVKKLLGQELREEKKLMKNQEIDPKVINFHIKDNLVTEEIDDDEIEESSTDTVSKIVADTLKPREQIPTMSIEIKEVKDLEKSGDQKKNGISMKKKELDQEEVTLSKNEKKHREKKTNEIQIQDDATSIEKNNYEILEHENDKINNDILVKLEMKDEHDEKAKKALRLQVLFQNMIADAVSANQEQLLGVMKENIAKEFDFQFRQLEELQEERDIKLQEREEIREKERRERDEQHYKELDEILRKMSLKTKRKKLSKD